MVVRQRGRVRMVAQVGGMMVVVMMVMVVRVVEEAVTVSLKEESCTSTVMEVSLRRQGYYYMVWEWDVIFWRLVAASVERKEVGLMRGK